MSYIRLILIVCLLSCITYLFASIYFVATNSDVNEFIPYGQAQINFEDNEFEQINFEFTENTPWSVDCNHSNSGSCSIKSDSISHNEITNINLTLNIINGGYMSFYYFVDSEYSTSGNEFYDGLKFYINGEVEGEFQPETNGDSSWNYYNKYISSGVHNFSWSYIKDGGDGDTASDIDGAWIDDMTFPLSEPLFYEYYNQPDPQNISSGLFNAFILSSSAKII